MRLGLFSVSYAGTWGQHALGLPAFIARAAGLGYDAVMLAGKRPHLSPLDADERLAEVKAALRQHRVSCTVAVQNHHDVLLELLADLDRPNC